MQYFSWFNEVLPGPKPDSLLSVIKTIVNFSRQDYDCYLGRLRKENLFLILFSFYYVSFS